MNILFIFGAKYLFIGSIILAGWYVLCQPRLIQKRMILLAALSSTLSGLVALVAGHIYTNPRPFVVDHFIPLIPHVANNGFPSDHALLVGWIAAFLYPFDRRVSLALFLIALLVGVSRVYVGVHHPIDIIASFVIVAIITTGVFWVIRRSETSTARS